MKSLKSKKTVPAKTVAVKTSAKAKSPVKAVKTSAKTAAPAKQKTSAKKTQASTSMPKREITTESIAAQAYILWEQAGRPHGRDVEFWVQAEKLTRENTLAA